MNINVHVPAETSEEAMEPIAATPIVVLVNADSEAVFRVTVNLHGGIRVETIGDTALAVALVEGSLSAIDLVEVVASMPLDRLEIN